MINKIKLLGVIGLMAGTLFLTSKVEAKDINDYYKYYNSINPTLLGKSIDVVGAKSHGDIALNNVLSDSYYESFMYRKNESSAFGKSKFYSGRSAKQVQSKINEDFSYEAGVSGLNIKGVTLGARNKYSLDIEAKYSNYYSRSYVEYYTTVESKKYFIEDANTSDRIENCKNNLSKGFEDDLDRLDSNQISFEKFFHNYGTHILTNYITGYKFVCDAYLVSNDNDVEVSFNAGFHSSIDAKIMTIKTGADASTNLDIYGEYGLSESKTIFEANVLSSGISPQSFTDMESLFSCINYWTNQVRNNKITETIIDYDYNSLIPIWDIIPDEHPGLRERMISKFEIYHNKHLDDTNFSDEDIEINIEPTTRKRSFEKTIEDKDRFNYQDPFEINDTYGHNVIAKKYDAISFNITFYARRKYKGYQYLYLYNATDTTVMDDKHHKKCLWESEDLDVQSVEKKYELNFTIDIDDFTCDTFVIVWRAKGDGEDTWYNKNLEITMTFIPK